MALIVKDDWLTYLLIFLCALLGMLIGFLIGKVVPLFFILLAVIALSLVIAGLIIAWAVNRKNQLLEAFTLKESFKEQYNALGLLINELEHNLNAENGAQIKDSAWQELKNKYAYFPIYIYEDLLRFYDSLIKLTDFEIVEYRRVIMEEFDLPGMISQLKEWQLKIKRQLPYLD
jgi:hypothetical protein